MILALNDKMFMKILYKLRSWQQFWKHLHHFQEIIRWQKNWCPRKYRVYEFYRRALFSAFREQYHFSALKCPKVLLIILSSWNIIFIVKWYFSVCNNRALISELLYTSVNNYQSTQNFCNPLIYVEKCF